MLEAKNVSFAYASGEPVLRDLSLSVGAGEIMGLFGRSGTGKSTTLRLLAALECPTSGQVLLDGVRFTRPSVRVGMMFQSYALFEWYSCLDNVAVALRMAGRRPHRATALEFLELVGLERVAQVLPNALSGGMRQRLALARALAVEPDVLLLDEPFSALDTHTKAETINATFGNLHDRAIAAIVVAHDPGTVVPHCDKILILQGRPATTMVPRDVPDDLRTFRSHVGGDDDQNHVNDLIANQIETTIRSEAGEAP